jgi:hypothetical protein
VKRRLHILVDSVNYVKNEVYQHQLHRVLNAEHDCVYHEIGSLSKINIQPSDLVFSALKIRTLKAQLSRVEQALNRNHLIVQDYDPWVSYEDGSPHKGTYETIASKLNVTFFVPHSEWSKFIQSRGHKCVTSKIGMLPEYCDANPWTNRNIRVEFRGSSYPSRRAGISRLINAGFPDCWNKNNISPYDAFLRHLSTVRVWAQSETEPLIVDGKAMCRNWLWPKAIEVLSRGCFLVRDEQPEAENYTKDMPTVFLFKDETEALGLLEQIEAMSDAEKNERIQATVDMVQNARYYQVISEKIGEWYDDVRCE